MDSPAWIDLNAAIDGWRGLLLAGGIWPAEVDELEGHLRDRVDDLVRAGLSEQDAFGQAALEMGEVADLERELTIGRRPRDFRTRLAELAEPFGGALLASYFRVARRALRRDRGYTAISTSGLALGIALCLLLAAYVRHELSYDAMHLNADRVYRVAKGSRANTPGLWGPALSDAMPDVATAVRVMDGQFDRAMFRVEADDLQTGSGIVADAGFFELFSWQLARGNQDLALDAPGSIVLSRQMAHALFGDADAMGRALILSGGGDFPPEVNLVVTGILDDSPGPSHLSFEFIVSMSTVDALDRGGEWGTPFSWTNAFVKTYVLTRPGASSEDIQDRFPAFIEQRVASDRYRKDDVFLQPLRSIHLRSRLRFDPPGSGGIRSVRLLLGLSVFLLGIAVANFVNLAVARSLQRSREIAMRKVVGAARPQLVAQLLGEALVVAALATLLALPLVYAARPWFEVLTGRPLPVEALFGPWTIPFLAVVAAITGLVSGLYPAILMSSLTPSSGLRAGTMSVGRGLSRRALIIVQFAIAIGLVSTTVLVIMQMRFIGARDLGYKPEGLIMVRIGQSEAVTRSVDAMAARLEREASIEGVGTSHSVPSAFLNEFSYRSAGADLEDRVSLGSVSVGRRFFETFGMNLSAGRFLEADLPSDSTAFAINVSAARQLGFDPAAGALGQRIEWLMPGLGFGGTIVGITEDLHFGSLRDHVPPIVFHLSRFGVSFLTIRPADGQVGAALSAAERAWLEVEPSHPFEPEMLTDRIAFQYEAEKRLIVMVGVASGLAILLASLGLFGLTAFMAERRRKEIGIRKVLGASTGSLVKLFFREFLPWILTAFALVAPLAWLGTRRWLESFAFHVSPGAAPLAIGLAVTVIAAFAAIGLKTATASRANPVSSLQVE